MVATLSHTPPKPAVVNFYENSFKQLSMVQQKQVGLLVGVAVADAAARPLEGYNQAEIEGYLEEKRREVGATRPTEAVRNKGFITAEEERLLVFARVPPYRRNCCGGDSLKDLGRAPSTNASPASQSRASTSTHSFTYRLYYEMLRAMSRARGEFPVEDIQERFVHIAATVHEQHVFAAEHASLLHTLCTLLPTPVLYPYASDAVLRHYLDPFVNFLTESPSCEDDADGNSQGPDISPARAVAAERAAVRDYTFSVLGVVLRQLQSNPDATRNAAFMAVPHSAAVFPEDVQKYVRSASGESGGPTERALSQNRACLWELQRLLGTREHARPAKESLSPPRWLPQRCTYTDAITVREGLTIARAPITFTQGIAQAIYLGGRSCQRAMLVGALLGAKLGIRHIPSEWISATADHKPVSTMALEVAQWTWNPPHR